jgi:hypothetical protein
MQWRFGYIVNNLYTTTTLRLQYNLLNYLVLNSFFNITWSFLWSRSLRDLFWLWIDTWTAKASNDLVSYNVSLRPANN